MKGDALKGHLDAMLLAVVADGPVHGYGIVQRLALRSHGRFELPEGTIYPALHRLEDDGLLRSRWAVIDGRRRRQYELTDRGRSALGVRSAQWREFAAAVDQVLGAAVAAPLRPASAGGAP